MAFPTIIGSVAHRHQGSTGSAFTVPLPDGSNVPGRILMVGVSKDGNEVIKWPEGWNILAEGGDPSIAARTSVAWRRLAGDEGYPATGASIVVTDGSQQWASFAYLLDSVHSTTDPEATTASGNAGACNAPELTASWGVDENMFLLFYGWDSNSVASGTVPPPGYEGWITDAVGGTAGCGHATAYRFLEAASDDPATFSIGRPWRAVTVAVRGGLLPRGAQAIVIG